MLDFFFSFAPKTSLVAGLGFFFSYDTLFAQRARETG